MSPDLFTAPLHERHVALGAKFAEFGGWSMPLEYSGSGILAEHHAVRNSLGVFDVSHLGKIRVTGEGSVEYLNTLLTNDLRKIGPGQAQYTLLCTEDGGVIDDLIAYVFADDHVFLIPNAANTARVFQVLSAGLPDGLTMTNLHHDYAVLAVQGPNAAKVLEKMGLPTQMDYMAFQEGDGLTICRTGYTGELGFELVVQNEAAGRYFDELLAAGEEFDIKVCGLGARDTLRTEMGYPLHGNDISPEINPVEAGVGWAIGWAKPEFGGSEALKQIKADGPGRRMRGLKAVGRGIPRSHMDVVSLEDSEPLGVVTSGTFSPTMKQGIGLALIDSSVELGDRIGVVVRNRIEEFEVVKPPFVTTAVRT